MIAKIEYVIRRLLKTFIGVLYAVKKLPIRKAIQYYDKNAENVIWVYVFGYQYPIDCMIRDLILVRLFSEKGIHYRIQFGKKVGQLSNKKIYINPSKLHDVYRFKNHCSIIAHLVKELEKQNNRVTPSYHDLLFWENKEHMHAEFERLSIPTPKTFIIQKKEDLVSIQLSFPFLLKDTNAHHSKGLFKVKNMEEALSTYDAYSKLKPGLVFLAQELIRMHRDLRVIHIGNEIFLHYWRNNPNEEWQPTSTSYGSAVDFISFPEKWRNYIQEQFNKLNMLTGAWDITWQDDDLDGTPIFLEISPLYAANPIFDVSNKKYNYGDWKEKLLFKDSFEKHYYEIVYEYSNKKLMHL